MWWAFFAPASQSLARFMPVVESADVRIGLLAQPLGLGCEQHLSLATRECTSDIACASTLWDCPNLAWMKYLAIDFDEVVHAIIFYVPAVVGRLVPRHDRCFIIVGCKHQGWHGTVASEQPRELTAVGGHGARMRQGVPRRNGMLVCAAVSFVASYCL